jgi:hypothetical protein
MVITTFFSNYILIYIYKEYKLILMKFSTLK